MLSQLQHIEGEEKIPIFVATGERAHQIHIKPDISDSELAAEIVRNGLSPGVFAFNLYFNGNKLHEGPIRNEGIGTNSCVVARPTLISTIDLQVRTLTGDLYLFEVFPNTKIEQIRDQFNQKSGQKNAKDFFVMNGQLLKNPSDPLIQYMARETDVMFVVTAVESSNIVVYVNLGNDLMMMVQLKPDDKISKLREEIQKRYHIPTVNQRVYWHSGMVTDDKVINSFAPENNFLLFSIELVGPLEVSLSLGREVLKGTFEATSTIKDVKEKLLRSKHIDPASKHLAFDGVRCSDSDGLFSFYRIKPHFTIAGESDPSELERVVSVIKAGADSGEASYLYIYGRMLFSGTVVPQNREKAAEYLKRAVDKGHYSAMTDYAEFMFNNELPEISHGAALQYAVRAADAGHVGAQFLVGKMQKKAKKWSEASIYFTKAANAGHTIAQAKQAHIILRNKNIDINERNRARELLLAASKRKHAGAMKYFAVEFLKKEDKPDEAVKLLKEAAHLGSKGAQYHLAVEAVMKPTTSGVGDWAAAVLYAEKSSQLGHCGAKRLLGMMYKRGLGVEKDLNKAFELLSEAAEKDEIQAIFQLAKMYLRGDGCEKDEGKAIVLLRKAVSYKHTPSILLLINILLRGVGCDRNYDEAFAIARRATIETGNAKCMRMLGVCYRDGYGTEVNIEEAASCLKKAANSDYLAMYHYAMLLKSKDDPRYNDEIINYLRNAEKGNLHEAQEELGLIYLKLGKKLEAEKYFTLAAKAGLVESQYQLGVLLLEQGDKDVLAAQYIESAAKVRHPRALYQYSILLEQGRGVAMDIRKAREFLQAAANFNVDLAQHRLGMKLCDEGNIPEGIRYLRLACESNLVIAMMDLVDILKRVGGSPDEILALLMKAAELDNVDAMVMSGVILEERERYYEAFQMFRDAAARQRADALYHYGRLLESGHGTISDPPQAASAYDSAVKLGYVPAIYRLGRCYERGVGVEQNYAHAAYYYRMSAENRDADGMVGIGKLCAEGKGVDKDETLAVQYYRCAVDLGHVAGNYELGFMYENGRGVPQDLALAFSYFKYASDRGYAPAMVYHARKLLHGIGVAKDIDEGRIILMKAVNLGEMEAMFELAELLDYEKKHDEAFTYYQRAADLGHIKAMNCTAIMLSRDPAQKDKAIEYIEKAADGGDVFACCNFGIILARGDGVIRDQRRALTYLRQAADAGIVEAMYNCGVLLMTAKSTTKNESEAKVMFQEASSRGHMMSKFNLATMMISSEPRDVRGAMTLFRECADNGLIDAIYLFAYYTYTESQGNVDYQLALQYAKKGADLNEPRCIALYGTMLLNGKGTVKSELEAVDMFRKAAEMGNPDGMYNYGVMLFRGVGVGKDVARATEYLNKARNYGHEFAETMLEQNNLNVQD